MPSGSVTVAVSLAKLTTAVTPSSRLSRVSIRLAHDAQVMPVIGKVSFCSMAKPLSPRAGESDGFTIYPHTLFTKTLAGNRSASRQKVRFLPLTGHLQPATGPAGDRIRTCPDIRPARPEHPRQTAAAQPATRRMARFSASASAACRLPPSARPLPARSSAVPWSTEVRISGSPSVTLMPCPKLACLSTGKP